MDAIVAERAEVRASESDGLRAGDTDTMRRVGALFPDPLDDDAAGDELVVTTRRAIGRVAQVATETATRFQREGIEHDPMSWMYAPRALLNGASAVDSCLDRDACMRGILVHGLGLGLTSNAPLSTRCSRPTMTILTSTKRAFFMANARAGGARAIAAARRARPACGCTRRPSSTRGKIARVISFTRALPATPLRSAKGSRGATAQTSPTPPTSASVST